MASRSALGQPHITSSDSIESGFQLGDYDVIAEVARGGMGRVFLGRRIGQPELKPLYAIKVIHERMVNDPQALAMMVDEANITSRLQHPNIVHILELGESRGRHFVVMEFVDGFPLHRVLKKNKSYRPPRLIVPILIDGLRGLHAAHELCDDRGRFLNLVHRDFAPDNLLVDLDGICRVIDFGIAKIAARRMAETEDGMNKGKLAYMSPEQLSAAKGIDRRADLWTAGVVLYEALTGVHPFRGSSTGTTISNILRCEPDLPSTIGLCPPPHFDGVCIRALSRQREARFATANEMLEELRSIALEQEILGERSEVAEWVMRTFEKHIAGRDEILQKLEIELPVDENPLPVFPMSSLSGSWDGVLDSSRPDVRMARVCSEKIAPADGEEAILTPPPKLFPSQSPLPAPIENREAVQRVPAEKSALRSGSVLDVSALGVDLASRPPPRPRPQPQPRRRPPRRHRRLIISCAVLFALVALLVIWRAGLLT